jgi:hypothetical protein
MNGEQQKARQAGSEPARTWLSWSCAVLLEAKMPGNASGGGMIALSAEQIALSEQIRKGINKFDALSLNNVELDAFHAYWLENVANLHNPNHGGDGEGQTIAIVDSGIDLRIAKKFKIDISGTFDSTGEGIHDHIGHGTAIALSISLVAPKAKLIHVKMFNARSQVPGNSNDEQYLCIKLCFDWLRKTSAKIVNISWNRLSEPEDFPANPSPGFRCFCPLCVTISNFVHETGAFVFVSEGNYHYDEVRQGEPNFRPTGAWTCPTGAMHVIPVMDLTEGRRSYDNNFEYSAAIPFTAQVRLAPKRKGWFGRRNAVHLIGTSFAAPFVAGTAASLLSAMTNLNYGLLEFPRNFEAKREDGWDITVTSYSFPLDLFCAHPASRSTVYNLNDTRDWRGMFFNSKSRVDALFNSQDYWNAGFLARFFACWFNAARKSLASFDLKGSRELAGIKALLEYASLQLRVQCIDAFLQSREGALLGLVASGSNLTLGARV